MEVMNTSERMKKINGYFLNRSFRYFPTLLIVFLNFG